MTRLRVVSGNLNIFHHRSRFAADFFFPAAVRGPVDFPPCSLHRPFLKALQRQDVPLRVLAPHRSPGRGVFLAR